MTLGNIKAKILKNINLSFPESQQDKGIDADFISLQYRKNLFPGISQMFHISALNTLGGGLISTIANENPSFCISGVFVPELEFDFSASSPFDFL